MSVQPAPAMAKTMDGAPPKRRLVWLRLTDEQLADVQKAAAQEGQTVSEFARTIVVRAALIRLGKL